MTKGSSPPTKRARTGYCAGPINLLCYFVQVCFLRLCSTANRIPVKDRADNADHMNGWTGSPVFTDVCAPLSEVDPFVI